MRSGVAQEGRLKRQPERVARRSQAVQRDIEDDGLAILAQEREQRVEGFGKGVLGGGEKEASQPAGKEAARAMGRWMKRGGGTVISRCGRPHLNLKV